MEVMEVLLFLGLWMSATGLFVQAGGPHPDCPPDHHPHELFRLLHTDSCLPAIHDLLRLIHTESCLPAVMVWEKLNHLTPGCRDNILTLLSGYFGQVLNIPSYCQCDWRFHLPDFTVHGEHEQRDHETCFYHDYEYRHLYNTYVANDANHGHGVCTTHHQVWHHLHNVHHTEELHFCRDHLITQLFHAYEHHGGYNCAMVQATVTAAPAVTTTTSLAPVLAIPCNKYATITSLAYEMQFHHPLAASCGTKNDHRGSDALVFNLCQTKNDTSQWKEGPNVMSNCPNIPLYTPIATFINGAYSTNGGLSGIFVGCLPDGFKIAVQECGSNSTILNLGHGGILTHDPNLYFVVRE